MTAIIVTRLADDRWQATTPHAPGLKADGPEEHLAINRLIEEIRTYRRAYESEGRPVPWYHGAEPPSDNECIVRRLSGVTPPATVEAMRQSDLSDDEDTDAEPFGNDQDAQGTTPKTPE